MPRFIPYSTLDALCDLGQTLSPHHHPHLSPSPYQSLGLSPASAFHDPFHDSGLRPTKVVLWGRVSPGMGDMRLNSCEFRPGQLPA